MSVPRSPSAQSSVTIETLPVVPDQDKSLGNENIYKIESETLPVVPDQDKSLGNENIYKIESETLPVVPDQDESLANENIYKIESETLPVSFKEVIAFDPVDDLTSAFETLDVHESDHLLFRVVSKESWGSALLNKDILPGNTTTNALEDLNFDWRAWLKNHGDREGGESIGTSCTTDFVRALTIALQYRFHEKEDISIIVIQERFLVNGSCHAFDDLILWSALPSSVFGPLKKNEHIIIGPIPAHAIVSRITFDSLEELDYLTLFPQLHFDGFRKVREVRDSIVRENGKFDLNQDDLRFFLEAILGDQFGAYPQYYATRQLLIHFKALANGRVSMENIRRYESRLRPDALESLETIARNIRTKQKLNKAVFLSDADRVKSEPIDVEGAIKGWARRNPYSEL
ncbi:hypothetical protein E2P81_ATG05814 [Venturia nashicola]|nr:hypothetical protein E2P81_ATG05814 [Venturia nashicola]